MVKSFSGFDNLPDQINSNTSSLADIAQDVKNFGAKGDGTTDDSNAIQNAINSCVTNGRVLYFPKGTYLVRTSLNANGLIGVKGESMSSTKILAGASMTTVFVNQNTSRMSIQDITVDGGGLANNCIDTSYSSQGPSLDNTYRRVLVRQYIQTGWIADNNNDCWFEDCMFIEPFNGTSTGGLSANASGGPLQFINCNFLDDVVVGSQYTSFVNCVNKGITVQYSGFNVLKYEGGYLMQGKNNCAIYLPGSSEIGPVTFSGSHIEIPNGTTVFGGTGKVHYGVDFTGCHIMNNSGTPTTLNFLASTITSSFAYCWLRFKGCRIENFNTPIVDSIGFQYDYLSSYANTVPINNSVSLSPTNGYTNVGGAYGNAIVNAKNKRVVITGTLNVGTKTNGTVIATIPAGYRPSQTVTFVVNGYDGSANLYLSSVKITTDGNIAVFGNFNTNMAYLDFDGIVYDM